MNEPCPQPAGIYRDRIYRDRTLQFDSGWHSNIIVDECRQLLAAFMMGESALGIQFLAVGQGDPNWDSNPPGVPAAGTQTLVDSAAFEINVGSPQILLEYLDAIGNPVAGPSNRIQVTIDFEPGSPPIASGEDSYPLREFGLFGQRGSSNFMIDYVRHPVIHKGPDDTLVRTVRLVF